ncbi:hypothetical protein ACQWG3_24365, partial [Salmonella enterica subsp. enterica serovar Infantis]
LLLCLIYNYLFYILLKFLFVMVNNQIDLVFNLIFFFMVFFWGCAPAVWVFLWALFAFFRVFSRTGVSLLVG